MRYIPDAVFERQASELWNAHALGPGFEIERIVDHLEIGLLWEQLPEDGGGRVLGLLDPGNRRIVLNELHLDALEAHDGALRRFTIGHELGHWFFHAQAANSGTLSLLEGGRIWCRADSKTRSERQAEMFSACLLMPGTVVRELVPKKPWRGWSPIYELARTFIVSPTAMFVRLKELRLAHHGESDSPASGPPSIFGQSELFDSV